LYVLTNIELFSKVETKAIFKILSENKKMPQSFRNKLQEKGLDTFSTNIDRYRKIAIGIFVEENAYF
jgi:hypothetical protein